MALQLRTLATFAGPSDIPARAPMPNDAAGYVDFTANLHMTQAAAEVSNAAAVVFSRTETPRSGYYYGPADIEPAAHTLWDRIEYDEQGTPLGLLVEDTWSQVVTDAMRTDLTLGTAVGATVALSAASADAWRRWWSVTPTGAGEASLALTTSSHAINEYSYVHFDVRGSGIVQIGVKNADVPAYANVNLVTGEVFASDTNAPAQAKRRPGGGWTILIRVRAVTAGAMQPYLASVAALTTTKLGAAGLPFEARAPRVSKSTNANLPERSFYTLFTRAADVIAPVPALFDLAGDFTVAFRARSNWFASRNGAALALLSNGTTNGTEIRFNATNTLIARQTSGNVVVTSNLDIKWTPDTLYRVGLSRRGSQIDVAVNGRVMSFDTGAMVSDATPSLFGSWDTSGANGWAGHLQKAIWWAHGRAPADLAALVDRWL